jgi:hypothetical protein
MGKYRVRRVSNPGIFEPRNLRTLEPSNARALLMNGSESKTPDFDSLADNGVRFSHLIIINL